MTKMDVKMEDGYYIPLAAIFIIDQNSRPELRLVFPKDFSELLYAVPPLEEYEGCFDDGSSWYLRNHAGFIDFGITDTNDKWWSSRPACFMDIKKCIPVCLDGRSAVSNITPEYYEFLKKKFDLKYDIAEVDVYGELQLDWVLPDINQHCGETFMWVLNGKEKGFVMAQHFEYMTGHRLICTAATEEGTRYLNCRDLPIEWLDAMDWHKYLSTRDQLQNQEA